MTSLIAGFAFGLQCDEVSRVLLHEVEFLSAVLDDLNLQNQKTINSPQQGEMTH